MRGKNTLRVLHVDDGRGSRTARRQAALLMAGLKQVAHEVALLCPSGGESEAWARRQGIAVNPGHSDEDGTSGAGSGLESALRETVPDIVHAHSVHAFQAAAAALQGVPQRPLAVTCSQRGDLDAVTPLLSGDAGRCRLVWALTPEVGQAALEAGARPEQVLVAAAMSPPATEPGHAGGALRQQLGLPPSMPVVGLFSGAQPAEALVQALGGLSRLRADLPAWHLAMAWPESGDGTLSSLIQNHARKQQIHLLTPDCHAADLVAASDLVLLLGAGTQSSLALLDALASGVPVVSTPGGFASRLLPRTSGQLVPFQAPGHVAVALARLLTDADRARHLAEEGSHRARAAHAGTAVAAELAAAYGLALERRQGQPRQGPGLVRQGRIQVWGRSAAVRRDMQAAVTRLEEAGPAETEVPPGLSGRAPVSHVLLDGQAAVLKRQQRGGLPGRLARLLPGSLDSRYAGTRRASRGTTTARVFRARGGAAPAPLAWLARHHAVLASHWSAAEEVKHAVGLDQVLRDTAGDAARHSLLAALGRGLAHWHHAGLDHRDLNAGNILVARAGHRHYEAEDFVVIDLDSACIRRRVNRRRRASALSRLERSLRKHHLLGAEQEGEAVRVLAAYGRQWALLEGLPPAQAAALLRQLLPALARRRLLFPLHGIGS